MKNPHIKNKIIIYLTLPIFIMTLFIVFMIIYMGHFHNLVKYLSFTCIVFVGIAILEIFIFKTKIQPYFNENEKIKRLMEGQETSARLLIRRDLELTRANEQLRELDQRKSEFISVVAHQLRTPLSGIKWTLNMLLNGDLGKLNPEQKTFLMKGYESNQRMITLVEDMLNADRVNSGKYSYNLSLIQITDLIDNTLYDLVPLANKKNIKINYLHSPVEVPKVIIDPEKMRQVIQNLVENAIKYTPKNGEINITVSVKSSEFVEVSIADSGIGIPEDQKKQIFTRFFRAKNAVKVETDGSGLGLFIVKGIVEKHGGTVGFNSEEGKGTTFYFTTKIG